MSREAEDTAFSVLLLTEDGSEHAPAVLELLIKRLFRHLDDRCQTQRINFEPGDGEARRMFTANAWMEHRRDRVRVHNYVAQKLHNERGFVVHHVDADQTWQQYTAGTQSPQITKLEHLLLAPVRKLLHGAARTRRPGDTEASIAAEVDARMARFFRLIPCREIEAWLYQNTAKALALACRRPSCGCVTHLEQWCADRGRLDEHPDPPGALPCVGKRHNLELVQGLPVAEVHAAGKSLAAALDALFGCEALLHAIERTYQPARAPSPS